MSDNAPIDILRRRSDAYRLVAAAFYPPCKEWHEMELFTNLKELLGSLYPDTAEASEILNAAFAEASLDDLIVEAARLFIGPFELAIPLYGSCHLEEGRKTMGESTMAVQEIYRAWGMELAADTKEVPDHLAIELEFLQVLLHAESEALSQDDDSRAYDSRRAQAEFMGTFLMPFALSVAEQLKTSTENHFYLALGDVLTKFIRNEESILLKGPEPA